LSLLFYFKYAYFIVENLNSFFETNLKVFNHFAFWVNEATGSQHFEVSQILLPVGISFFTFQTISYSVDIYRGKIKPVDSIFDFGFYVSFFPQLVAGPIVRASEFIPQIHLPYNVSKKEFSTALFFILNGLVKKLLVADYIAINFIDRIFENPQVFTGFENMMAVVAYSLQIYCDFSGYTDIAIGIALLMGFKLSLNFNSPYKAKSLADFWRRWHISFSTWLKDYLYIPLGGNKRGGLRTNINLMITMLLGGFWHGASWQFVIWGGLNGIGLIFYKYWKRISPYEKSNLMIVNFWKIFITFSFISFTRIWFRSDTLETANMVIHRILNYFQPELMIDVVVNYKNVFLIMLFGFVMHWLPAKIKESYIHLFDKSPVFVKGLVTAIVIIIVYQSLSANLQPFVYFQF
jgi:D-alanyl-lipoteichoic acid acyltransferase DltB (MBOAT superfamily)